MAHTRRPRWPLAAALLLTLAVASGLRLAYLPDLPLGLHYDEAANGILAGEIARGTVLPVFIPSYTGKEVLFFYLAAALMRALGEGVLALRLTAALCGLATVAAASWSVAELLHARREARWIGALSAAFLATSFWHLVLSRYGFRAVTQPLLQALTAGALWRGLRLEHRGWLLAGGSLLGATAYTYLAARAFPLPVALAAIALVVADRGHRWTRLAQVALVALAAAVVIAPLAAYFVGHPDALTARTGQVAARSWSEACAGLVASLGAFFLRGDPVVRFNLPGCPLLDPVTAVLFVLGIVAILFDRPAAPSPAHLAARVFLVCTLVVMLLPSALATDGFVPSNLRSVGLLPFVYVFPALGLTAVGRRLQGIIGNITRGATDAQSGPTPPLPSRSPTLGHFLAVLLVLGALTPLTAIRYFRSWARSPVLYNEADGDLVDVADYLNASDLEDTTIYVASIHYRHPTLAFLSRDYLALRWLTGGETVVLPAVGEGLLILPRSADGALAWLADLPSGTAFLSGPVAAPPGPDGEPAFHAYRLPAGTLHTPETPLTSDFGHAVTLLGFDLLQQPLSGETVEALFTWRVEAIAAPSDLMPAVRLTDPWGGLWGEARPFHYPAEQWTPGELLLDHLSVPVGPGAPPGEYRLWLGMYAASDGSSLPVLDSAGAYAGTAVAAPITVGRAAAPPDLSALPIRHRLDLTSDAGVTLLGISLDTPTARPGEPLVLTLFWRADRDLDPGLVVRLRLGTTLLAEGEPVHGTYPTAAWAAGEVVADRYDPRVPLDTAPGTYPLHLALVMANADTALHATLGQVVVEGTGRLFEPPTVGHALDVTLGDQVRLLGYDLDPSRPAPGGRVTLTLYWQALTEMETSYTVFTHLLSGDGGVVAQHDGTPAAGSYPTNLWVAGEVVEDAHVLELPTSLAAGTYTVEVGMYVLETGARLAAPGSADGSVRFPVVIRPR
jgi:hypothetical protein